MRKLLHLALLLTALLPTQVQAASSVAGSWPTNAYPLVDGATISPLCPGSKDTNGVGVSGFYTLTVTGNNHTISLPQCTIPNTFQFAITQGSGGPYTGLSFSSAGTLKWPGGGAVYVQTPIAGTLDYVSGTISNLTGSNEWDVTGVTNVSNGFSVVAGASNTCASTGGAGAACTTTNTNMLGVNLIVGCIGYYNGASGTSTFSDSLGNSYTQVYSSNESNLVGTLVYKQAPTVSSTMTFTASATGGATYPGLAVMGFSGALASPLDQSTNPAALGNVVTTLQPGSLTPSQANELLVSCLTTTSSASTGIGSPFTLGPKIEAVSGVSEEAALGYQIQAPGPAAENPAWTWTNGADAVAGQATFK